MFGVTKYAQVSREPRTCGVHTHTRVMPNTRQREAREGLSVHAETARSVDPAISETNDSVVASRGNGVAPAIAEDPVSRRRRIEGRSMTLTDHAARLI